MIGLLGVGLTTFNTSEQLTVSGKIKEQIVGDLEQAGWAGVLQQYFGISNTSVNAGTTWVGSSPVSQNPLKYDEYGNALTDQNGNLLPAATATPTFQAVVTPVTTSGGDGPASSPSLIEFQIQISRVGVPNPATAQGTTTYTAFVAHN